MLEFRVPDAVKVYRTAAFAGLATEIKRYGALSRHEALTLFEQELITNAMRRKVCAERKTRIGKLLYLLHQGRRLAGVTGMFTPTDDALMNAVCMRQVGLMLEKQGFTIDLTTRRRNIVYQDGDRRMLVLAQHAGYSVAQVRRLYHALIETGEYSEMHIYTYLDPEGFEAFAHPLYQPVSSQPLDPERLHLHRLVPLGRETNESASGEFN